jgi:hypothetical protein
VLERDGRLGPTLRREVGVDPGSCVAEIEAGGLPGLGGPHPQSAGSTQRRWWEGALGEDCEYANTESCSGWLRRGVSS